MPVDSGLMIAGGLGNAISNFADSFVQARERNEDKKYRKQLLDMQMVNQGLIQDPDTGEIKKSSAGVSKEQELARQTYSALTEDQKNSPMGQAILSKVIGNIVPMEPVKPIEPVRPIQPKQGLLQGSAAGRSTQSEGILNTPKISGGASLTPGLIDVVPQSKRGPWDPAPGKSKDDKEMLKYARQKQYDAKVDMAKKAAEAKDPDLKYNALNESTKEKIGTILQAKKDIQEYVARLEQGEGPQLINSRTPIIGGLISDTPITQLEKNISDPQSRLQSGGALNDAEQKFYRENLPRYADSKEERKYKLEKLDAFFDSKIKGYDIPEEKLKSVFGDFQSDYVKNLKSLDEPLRALGVPDKELKALSSKNKSLLLEKLSKDAGAKKTNEPMGLVR